MNYTTLQTAIASYMHRTDLASVIPTFIELAEASLNRELVLRGTETTETGTTTNSTITLPPDFGSVSRLTINYGGTVYALDYSANPSYSTGTVPTSYTVNGGVINVFPDVGTGASYSLTYTQKIVPLSGSNTTNWLLENHPDVYLYASSLEAAKHIRDDAQVQALGAILAGLVDSLRRDMNGTGQPIVASLQIKPRR